MKNRLYFLTLAVAGACLLFASCTKNEDQDLGQGWIRYDNAEYRVKSAADYNPKVQGITNGDVYSHTIISGSPDMKNIIEFRLYSASDIAESGDYIYGLNQGYGEDDKNRFLGRIDQARLVIGGIELTMADPVTDITITVVRADIGYSELRGQMTLSSGKTATFSYSGHL